VEARCHDIVGPSVKCRGVKRLFHSCYSWSIEMLIIN
jgi:hypothetical protein